LDAAGGLDFVILDPPEAGAAADAALMDASDIFHPAVVFRPFSGMRCMPCQAVDKGYASQKRKRAMRRLGVAWAIKDKALRGRGLSASQKRRNKKHGRCGEGRTRIPCA